MWTYRWRAATFASARAAWARDELPAAVRAGVLELVGARRAERALEGADRRRRVVREARPAAFARRPHLERHRYRFAGSLRLSTARNASCGTSTPPTCFMRFLPAFCFLSSFRLRVMSPP